MTRESRKDRLERIQRLETMAEHYLAGRPTPECKAAAAVYMREARRLARSLTRRARG